MKIEEIMQVPITITPEDALSKAFSIMGSKRIHQLAVLDGKKFLGLLELKNVITKNFDFSKTKVAGFETPTPYLERGMEAKDAARVLLESGLRALPVLDKEEIIGIVSESDLLRHIDVTAKVDELMGECVTVDTSETVSKVKDLMELNNVSRIPILESEKVVGIVETLDLIKVSSKQTLQAGGLTTVPKEKMRTEDIPIKNVMSSPFIIKAGTELSLIKDELANQEEALIIKDGSVNVFTPKDVISHFVGSSEKGVLVQLVNLQDESTEIVSKLHKAAEEFVIKSGKMVKNPEFLFIYIERHKTQSEKVKYAISTRFSTSNGLFVSKAWGWNLVNAEQEALTKLSREIEKARGKMLRRKGK